ncbi:PVC-type heme-binding CxxCH protein [Chitinophaga sp. MM2321]|uniref:PVC-type heme-binding CxxCH protein n=1 Tax=Chitinophaga sp. MM2321 TaxID=3137178 RepID=UPI0032D56E08
MKNRHLIQTLFTTATVALFCGCSGARYKGPLTPEAAIKTFDVADGFRVEVFAAEPYVKDPVEMVFDEQGNCFVIEMGDYPYKPEKGKGHGRIRQLKDLNNDGRIDTSIVFAEGLPSGTSILPWQQGLLVTAAPDILFMKDTDGDGRADSTEILFTGFFDDNSEAQITSLRYGVDNWIYANNNGQKGTVKFNRKREAPAISVGGGDFRFRLDKGLFEVESGSGQFGLAMDDYGHRFFTQNTLHIQTAPIPWRYLHRHNFLPAYKGAENIYKDTPVVYQLTASPYWRAERSARRQKAYDEQGLGRKEYAAGHFTGASGGTDYHGAGFPQEYDGSIFTAEVSCNLVHRDRIDMLGNGPFFAARSADSASKREFIASDDTWFRPVNLTNAPDGWLYLVDMYRQHIETPVSIPDDLKEDMDFMLGNQYGRIYRIIPTNAKTPGALHPDLHNKKTNELVALLANSSRWWRSNAQRLLVERKDPAAIPLLKELFNTATDPRARLHALYTLEGLDALNSEIVSQAMKDSAAGIREHGAILSERYPACLPLLLQLSADSVPLVAFQATLCLGQFPTAKVLPAMAAVLEKYAADKWFQSAILSADAGISMDFLQYLLTRGGLKKGTASDKSGYLTTFAHAIAARNTTGEVSGLLALAAQLDESYQVAILHGTTTGLKATKNKSAADATFARSLAALQQSTAPAVKEAAANLSASLEKK